MYTSKALATKQMTSREKDCSILPINKPHQEAGACVCVCVGVYERGSMRERERGSMRERERERSLQIA